LSRLRCLDGDLGQFFAVFHILVQPQFQCRAHKVGDQPHRIARVQPLLDLALKLRVKHLGGQHITGARKHVVGQQLDPLGQQRMHLDKTLDRRVQAVAQARLVGATRRGRNQVDIALAHRLTVFGKSHAPGRALAIGKTVMLGIGKTLALKQRNDRFTGQRLRQIVAQAAFEDPGL